MTEKKVLEILRNHGKKISLGYGALNLFKLEFEISPKNIELSNNGGDYATYYCFIYGLDSDGFVLPIGIFFNNKFKSDYEEFGGELDAPVDYNYFKNLLTNILEDGAEII